LIIPLFQHPQNSNGFVVFELRQCPQKVFELSADEIKSRLYTSSSVLSEQGKFRPAFKTIHINKCPMIAPASVLKTIPSERLKSWDLNIDLMTEHLNWIRSNPEFTAKIQVVFSEPYTRIEESDPDLMLYSGFYGATDKQLMQEVRQADESVLAEREFPFIDSRLSELLFRYKARNYPVTLTDEEQDKWSSYCVHKLLGKDSSYLTFEKFFERINVLLTHQALSPREQNILEDLKYYAESIYPYS
jgi:exodeoxyribonuclease-1